MTTYHGSEAKVAAKTDNTVAYTDADQVQTLSIDFDGGIHDIHELGTRDPQEIKEGHIGISGSLTRLFETGNFSAAGANLLDLAKAATEIFIALFPEGDASPKILVSNCKLGGWHLTQSLDGETEISVDYRGKVIALS